jgi:hypothetical protein
MKRWLQTGFLAIVLVFLSSIGSPPARAAANVSFDFFYSNLSSHGSWMVSGEYGNVWQPDVYDADWNPYYDGHWVYTDLGWTWVSDYSWGAVPYHYGTWVMDADYGWVWVPGYTWAPSWVVFRTGPDYIGWAPVAPSFSVGFSLGYSQPYAGSFVYVSSGDFLAPRMRSCIIPRSRTSFIVNRTHIVNNLVVENNIVVNRGPDLRLIERSSGRNLRPVRIEQVRNVAPEPRISRARLQIDTQRARHGIRVAEPVRDQRWMQEGRRPDREMRSRDSERDQWQDQNRQRGERSPRPDQNRSYESRDQSPQPKTFDSDRRREDNRDRTFDSRDRSAQPRSLDSNREYRGPRSDRPDREYIPRGQPYRPSRDMAEPGSPRLRSDRPNSVTPYHPSMREQRDRRQTYPESRTRQQDKKPPKKKDSGK